MFLRQLQLIVSALTCSLSAICAFLYQQPILQIIAMLGLLWSIYACHKIFKYDFNSEKNSKIPKDKKDPDVEIISQRRPEILLRNQELPNNINKEPTVTLKKEPIISKNLKRSSKS